MKIGDLVKIVKVSKPGIGILIEKRILHSEYRFDILCEDGKIVKALPETYIEVINESW